MLTDERVDAIFAELATYVIELEPDPTALGPQYFRDRIAICRNHLNRVSLITLELEREKLQLGSELHSLEAQYSLSYDELLANDPKIKNLGSIEDRKATVGYALRTQKQAITKIKNHLQAVEATYKVASHRTRELNNTMTAIKDQNKAMQTEIRSGSFYGDERPNLDSGINLEEEMARLLADESEPEETAEVVAESVEKTAPEAVSDQVVVSSSDEDEIQKFLSDGNETAKPEDDFSAFLDV